MTVRAALFDLDGVLADSRRRLPRLQTDPPDWEGYFADVDRDEPIAYAVELARGVALVMPVVIVTGRPERTRDPTLRWLVLNRVPFYRLLMRGDEDRRSNALVKLDMVIELRRLGVEPNFAIDDCPLTVEAYRARGIPALAADDVEWRTTRTRYGDPR